MILVSEARSILVIPVRSLQCAHGLCDTPSPSCVEPNLYGVATTPASLVTGQFPVVGGITRSCARLVQILTLPTCCCPVASVTLHCYHSLGGTVPHSKAGER